MVLYECSEHRQEAAFHSCKYRWLHALATNLLAGDFVPGPLTHSLAGAPLPRSVRVRATLPRRAFAALQIEPRTLWLLCGFAADHSSSGMIRRCGTSVVIHSDVTTPIDCSLVE
jgi:hypothetical protein